MIQGGDPKGTGKGGTSIWGKKFNDEIRDSLKVSLFSSLLILSLYPSNCIFNVMQLSHGLLVCYLLFSVFIIHVSIHP